MKKGTERKFLDAVNHIDIGLREIEECLTSPEEVDELLAIHTALRNLTSYSQKQHNEGQ